MFSRCQPLKEKLLSNEYGGSGLNLRSGIFDDFTVYLLPVWAQILTKWTIFVIIAHLTKNVESPVFTRLFEVEKIGLEPTTS